MPSESGQCLLKGASGSFCGATCSTTAPCPTGYTCDTIDLGGGQLVKQCVPDNNAECKCKASWASKGYDTTCFNQNGSGKCLGKRSCDTGTLSACDAKTPAAEKCDGLDNECDGVTDDGTLCDDSLTCTTDTCGGTSGCQSTILSTACKINFACYTDNQVNPNNACQKCDVAKSQTAWTINAGAGCNDGSVCTTGDKCQSNGTCVGTMIQDSHESNNSISTATWIGSGSDKDSDYLTGSGRLSGGSDIDWFKGHVTDTWNHSMGPQFSMNSNGKTVRACVFVKRDSGGTSVSCANSSTSATASGHPGCCKTGVNPSFGYDFSKAGSDDDATVWARIDKLSSGGACPTFSIKLSF